MSGMKPQAANSASRRSLMAISVGHFRSTPPSSLGNVCRRGDLRHLSEQLDITRGVIEVIVAHERAIGLTAQLTVFLLVHFLEERALVPGGALVFLERLAQVLLGNVEHTDLQHLVG